MDILIVSNNEKILHISNQEDKIDYTIYDNHCKLVDGGEFDLTEPLNNENAVRCVLEIVRDQIKFLKPYIYLPEELTNDLLELIQEVDYQTMQIKIKDYISCDKEVEHELEMMN